MLELCSTLSYGPGRWCPERDRGPPELTNRTAAGLELELCVRAGRADVRVGTVSGPCAPAKVPVVCFLCRKKKDTQGFGEESREPSTGSSAPEPWRQRNQTPGPDVDYALLSCGLQQCFQSKPAGIEEVLALG
ncbi:small integral membrane protein 7 isoform X3 [Cavia porcellus]|uniref:small integral membrane protein 7 isoform X3 n=1 Tax=Cavia porcellus TaxID=10141 RepID=UPI002FE3631A